MLNKNNSSNKYNTFEGIYWLPAMLGGRPNGHSLKIKDRNG